MLDSRVEKLVPVLRPWKSQDCLEIFLTSHESVDIDSRLVGKARRNEISQRNQAGKGRKGWKSSQRAPDIAWKGWKGWKSAHRGVLKCWARLLERVKGIFLCFT